MSLLKDNYEKGKCPADSNLIIAYSFIAMADNEIVFPDFDVEVEPDPDAVAEMFISDVATLNNLCLVTFCGFVCKYCMPRDKLSALLHRHFSPLFID